MPTGMIAGYFPEMNKVIALSDYDRKSGTPSYKSAAVIISKSSNSICGSLEPRGSE